MRAAAGLTKTKTLSVRERLSGRLFLADSGADVSVFPATASDKLASEGSCSLRAANGSGIKTFGTSTRHLVFPGVSFTHKFILANVTRPLLGADFFDAHELCVDFKRKRLVRFVDNEVDCAIQATFARTDPFSSFQVVKSAGEFQSLLQEFPEVQQPRFGHYLSLIHI